MRTVTFVFTLAVLMCLAQSSSSYRVTHTYALGGDGLWDYIVPDPPNHRLFIARQNRVMVVDEDTNTADGIPSGRSLRLRLRGQLPAASAQGSLARNLQISRQCCIRGTGRADAPPSCIRAESVNLLVKSVGKPDARNGHVRFDERGRETDQPVNWS